MGGFGAVNGLGGLGKWAACGKNPAGYSIMGGKEEWSAPVRPCQPCMIGIVRHNEVIRAVLMLQSATR